MHQIAALFVVANVRRVLTLIHVTPVLTKPRLETFKICAIVLQIIIKILALTPAYNVQTYCVPFATPLPARSALALQINLFHAFLHFVAAPTDITAIYLTHLTV